MDLDRLIQSCEFENKQYVKQIEKENQQIEALENEIEEKKHECQKFEDALDQLDEDTKRAHKQFTLNRDNCESLKKTMIVLMEHEVVLNRKLSCLITNGEEEQLKHESVVKNYRAIYTDYMTRYKTFPHTEELAASQQEIQAKEKLLQVEQEKLDQLTKQIHEIQGGSEVDFKNLNKFIVKLAEIKLDTDRAVLEKDQFENELREIQQKNLKSDEAEAEVFQQTVNISDVIATPVDEAEQMAPITNSCVDDVSPMISIFSSKLDFAEPKIHIAEKNYLSGNSSKSNEFSRVNLVSKAVPVTRMAEMTVSQPQAPPSVSMDTVPMSPVAASMAPLSVVSSRMSNADTLTRAPFSPRVAPVSSHLSSRPSPYLGIEAKTMARLPISPLVSEVSNRLQPKLIPKQSPNTVLRQLSQSIKPPNCQNISTPTGIKVKHRAGFLQPMGHDQRAPVRRLPPIVTPIRMPERECTVPPKTHEAAGQRLEPIGASRFISPPPANRKPLAPVSMATVTLQQSAHPSVNLAPTKSKSSTAIVSRPAEIVEIQAQDCNQNAKFADNDVVMVSPDLNKDRQSTPGRTPESSDNCQSPFDLERHLETIHSFSKSPGPPIYSQRPMFEDCGNQASKSPGPFLQTFNKQSSNTSRSAGDQPVGSNAQSVDNNGQPMDNNGLQMDMFSTPMDTSGDMKTLLRESDTPERTERAEMGFILPGTNKDTSDGSFLTMFSTADVTSPSQSQPTFSFNIGQETPKHKNTLFDMDMGGFNFTQESPSANQESFSFSFGGNRDSADDRSPSVFNLF